MGFLLVGSALEKHLFYQLSLIVGFSVVFAWLWFCSAYSGRGLHRNRRVQQFAIAVYVIVTALKVTNPLHGLYYGLEPAGGGPTGGAFGLVVTHETLYWVVMAVAYALSAAGYLMIFEFLLEAEAKVLPLGVLTGLTALPAVFNVVGHVQPALLDITHEPLGVAVFAVGLMLVYEKQFSVVQLTGSVGEPNLTIGREGRIRGLGGGIKEIIPPLSEEDLGRPLTEALPGLGETIRRGEPAWRAGFEKGEAQECREERAMTALTQSDASVRPAEHCRYFRVIQTSLGQGMDAQTVVLSDITEQKRRERELRESERRFQAMLNDPNILAGVLSPDGTFQKVNDTAGRVVDLLERPVRREHAGEDVRVVQHRLEAPFALSQLPLPTLPLGNVPADTHDLALPLQVFDGVAHELVGHRHSVVGHEGHFHLAAAGLKHPADGLLGLLLPLGRHKMVQRVHASDVLVGQAGRLQHAVVPPLKLACRVEGKEQVVGRVEEAVGIRPMALQPVALLLELPCLVREVPPHAQDPPRDHPDDEGHHGHAPAQHQGAQLNGRGPQQCSPREEQARRQKRQHGPQQLTADQHQGGGDSVHDEHAHHVRARELIDRRQGHTPGHQKVKQSPRDADAVGAKRSQNVCARHERPQDARNDEPDPHRIGCLGARGLVQEAVKWDQEAPEEAEQTNHLQPRLSIGGEHVVARPEKGGDVAGGRRHGRSRERRKPTAVRLKRGVGAVFRLQRYTLHHGRWTRVPRRGRPEGTFLASTSHRAASVPGRGWIGRTPCRCEQGALRDVLSPIDLGLSGSAGSRGRLRRRLRSFGDSRLRERLQKPCPQLKRTVRPARRIPARRIPQPAPGLGEHPLSYRVEYWPVT
nr:histidine kinase N-terminal 7TM domain-containing protein [Salinibacter ruber]